MSGQTDPAVQRVKEVPSLPPRREDAHKGDFGRILVLSGSVGMVGAPSLVATAALRSGAGLVTLAVPAPIQNAVSILCPCATSLPLPATPHGQIDPWNAVDFLRQEGFIGHNAPRRPDIVVTGPGVGSRDDAAGYGDAFWELIDLLRIETGVAAVIDADGLNLAGMDWGRRRHPRTVITPHPGELARMHDVSTRDIQADREGFAVRTARMMRTADASDDAIVVLKGARTIVTDGARIYVNTTGNPGMATGGSGDVLSGVIGALLGQHLEPFDAAVFGVYVHGIAGDAAAERQGQVSLIATDIIEALPAAFSRVAARNPVSDKR